MRLATLAVAVIALLSAPAADARPKHLHCPPGLAKKDPPCVPPGQANKRYRQDHDRDPIYRIGDIIDRDYDVLRDPWRYGLDPGQTYYRVGDYLYRVDRDTRMVLDLLGAVARLLN